MPSNNTIDAVRGHQTKDTGILFVTKFIMAADRVGRVRCDQHIQYIRSNCNAPQRKHIYVPGSTVLSPYDHSDVFLKLKYVPLCVNSSRKTPTDLLYKNQNKRSPY